MHLIYIDDSADEKLSVYSALALPADQWRTSFTEMKKFRQELRRAYGIYIYKELHAWKFVSGRGNIADRVVTKHQRASIFNDTLDLATRLPGVRLFNAVFPKSDQMRAFERMINRINRTLQAWGSHGVLVCDEGNEGAYTRLIRRMGVYNPIPSKYGTWQGTQANWKNIPIERIVEDPFFKPSDRSYFIQLVDFAAYSLLRRENQIASKNKYGLHQSFNRLNPILVRETNPRDPEGIIRP